MVPKSMKTNLQINTINLMLTNFLLERQSKRVRMAHRYRIAGRIKDHQRKERRGEKKNLKGNRSRCIIDGLWYFKFLKFLYNRIKKRSWNSK